MLMFVTMLPLFWSMIMHLMPLQLSLLSLLLLLKLLKLTTGAPIMTSEYNKSDSVYLVCTHIAESTNISSINKAPIR